MRCGYQRTSRSSLNYLLSLFSWDILSQISSVETAAIAWAVIVGMFASKSLACVISTRMAHATMSKVASSINECFTNMKALVDKMASVGKKLEDEELVSYI